MFLITAIQDLTIDTQELEEPFRLSEGLFLAWTPAFVKGLMSDPLKLAIGTLEYASLTDGSHVAAFIQAEEGRYRDRPLQALALWHHHIHRFFHCLWLIKDNSLNTEVGFVESKDSEGHDVTSSNNLCALYTCADGSRKKVRYSKEEFIEALRLYEVYQHAIDGVYGGSYPATLRRADQVEPVGTVVVADAVRALTRVWFFVSAARGCSDLSVKAVNYSTCLEVLFSTDSSEISHKLAERVALFLADDFEKRKGFFEVVKRLYSARSKVIHGDVLSEKRSKDLQDISQEADVLLRRVLRRIMLDEGLRSLFEGDKAARENYFIDLVLRDRSDTERKT